MDIGCFILWNMIVFIIIVIIKINWISKGSLIKILILEINDNIEFSFDVLKIIYLILIYKTNVFVKLLKLMLFLINLFYLFIFIFSLIIFISNRKHLLIVLIILEFIILILYICVYNFFLLIEYESYFIIMFLTFSVCEGAVGLSILVSLIRTHGNDYFQTYNILQC